MKIDINAWRLASLLSDREDRNEREGISDANHQLANAIRLIDTHQDPAVAVRMIVAYGAWVLDLVSTNPLEICHIELDPGSYCGDCGEVNPNDGT